MLTDSELKTLALLCDAFVPPVIEDSTEREFYQRSATNLGVDKALAAIIESKLEPYPRNQLRRLLRILGSRSYNLLLNGSLRPFSHLSESEREQLLMRWRDSRLGSKRAGFQGLKKLVLLLFYAVTDQNGTNPNWGAIGYAGPQVRSPLKHPQDLRIAPLVPDRDVTLECDICVVGAGAGGSVIAYELSKSGLDVIVVESGGYETAESFEQYELRMMDRIFMQHGFATTKDFALILLAGRGGGGGTLVNWMTCMKPPSFVLEEWEKDYGISGLKTPAFESYVEEVWNTLKINARESQRNLGNEALWKGCTALGYTEGRDFNVIQRDAVACNQRCAFCTYGCIYSCKQSTILNYLPMAFNRGARFLFDTLVERIVVEKAAARGVEATWYKEGRNFKVSIKSKVVVAACGAINTPALLLKSGIRQKNIGVSLRIHPTTSVLGYIHQSSNAWEGPPQTVAVKKFLSLENTQHGFWVESAPAHPGLFALASPWVNGRSHKELMVRKFAHTAATIVLVREWGSGKVEVDRYGSPSVTYQFEKRDKQNMVKGIQETARILAAAGASEIWTVHSEPVAVKSENGAISNDRLGPFFDEVKRKGVHHNSLFMGTAHIMGSCRMSVDESRGAANPHGELYGIENLFIGDASVFPTAPGVNPMVTIMSMARRTAESIKTKLHGS